MISWAAFIICIFLLGDLFRGGSSRSDKIIMTGITIFFLGLSIYFTFLNIHRAP